MFFLSFKKYYRNSLFCLYTSFVIFIFAFLQGNSNASTIEVEREAAKKHMKERRLKAKRKREIKQQEELALAVSEKEAIEDELEELKIAASTNSDERVHELFEKKLLKMKKKYEKKIAVTRMDLLDATEVFIVSIIELLLLFYQIHVFYLLSYLSCSNLRYFILIVTRYNICIHSYSLIPFYDHNLDPYRHTVFSWYSINFLIL